MRMMNVVVFMALEEMSVEGCFVDFFLCCSVGGEKLESGRGDQMRGKCDFFESWLFRGR